MDFAPKCASARHDNVVIAPCGINDIRQFTSYFFGRFQTRGRRDDGWMLDELKEDVGRIIPGDVLARLADENPRRARSELQSACKQAFASPRWAGRSNELKARISRDLEDIVFGMGPLQSLVEDPTITEVMVNGTSSLFIERSGLLERETAVFTDEAQVRALIDRILAPLGRRVDESSPMVDARLPGGHRVNVVIPPIALDGPTITIRKFANTTMTLGDMQRAGSLDGRVSRPQSPMQCFPRSPRQAN